MTSGRRASPVEAARGARPARAGHRAHRDHRPAGAARPALLGQRLLAWTTAARSSTRLHTARRPRRRRSTPATPTTSRRSSSGSSTTSWRRGSSVGARPTPRARGWRWSPPPTTSCATAAWPSRPSPAWTRRSGTCSGGRSACRCTASVGSVTDAVPISVIGGYYHLDRSTRSAELIARLRRRRASPGVQVQGRRQDARPRTPPACAPRARRAGPDFALMVDANQGYDRAQAVEFGRLVCGPRHPLVRGALPLDERPPLDARRPVPDRASRSAPARARRPSRGIRDLIIDGRDRRLATSTRRGPAARRSGARRPACAAAFGVQLGHHEEPQVVGAPAGERPRPHLRRVLRRGARPVLLAPVRHVHADRRRPLHAARAARLRHRAGLGLRRGPIPSRPGRAIARPSPEEDPRAWRPSPVSSTAA